MEILPRTFFLQPTLTVARQLLGKRIYSQTHPPLEIVETEAYCVDDPACHAFRGKSVANAAMFGPPGTAYIHINYGIHHCLNVVCQPEDTPEAVLIRAVQPLVGDGERTLWAGPGRLAKTLGITKPTHTGIDLCDAHSPLWLADGHDYADVEITVATRIGITRGADYPWRFYLTASRLVSRR